MARKVFFSFHHQHDYWRVGQVRNSWLTKGAENTFIDAAEWEKIKTKGHIAVKKWIDRELEGTTVTVVLIGEHTAKRRYVRYELEQSYKRRNGIIGVYIHGIKDERGNESWRGRNPLRDVKVKTRRSVFGLWDYESEETLADICDCYYWFDDNGRENLPAWIEAAALR